MKFSATVRILIVLFAVFSLTSPTQEETEAFGERRSGKRMGKRKPRGDSTNVHVDIETILPHDTCLLQDRRKLHQKQHHLKSR
jgi:hypothetical protein